MNKISRRNFLKVAGAGAAAMGLAACGGSSSSSSSVAASSTAANAAADTLSGTIEYWSSWSETENQALVLKQAADAFTQLHPNVKINFTFNGRDNRNLVVSAIEAGTQIDLICPTLLQQSPLVICGCCMFTMQNLACSTPFSLPLAGSPWRTSSGLVQTTCSSQCASLMYSAMWATSC